MVIENQYIQTSLMVALSLFRGKEGGGARGYKSELNAHIIPDEPGVWSSAAVIRPQLEPLCASIQVKPPFREM